MDSKQCTRCDEVKPLSDFYPDKRYAQGVKSWCRKCTRTYQNAWRRRDPGRYREQNRKWREAHPEKMREYSQAYALRHPERLRLSQRIYRQSEQGKLRSMSYRWKQSSFTAELVAELLEQQEHRCAICSVVFTEPRLMHADHDHATGKPRGILCRGCNHGIGNFMDGPLLMENAIVYLKKHGR